MKIYSGKDLPPGPKLAACGFLYVCPGKEAGIKADT